MTLVIEYRGTGNEVVEEGWKPFKSVGPGEVLDVELRHFAYKFTKKAVFLRATCMGANEEVSLSPLLDPESGHDNRFLAALSSGTPIPDDNLLKDGKSFTTLGMIKGMPGPGFIRFSDVRPQHRFNTVNNILTVLPSLDTRS